VRSSRVGILSCQVELVIGVSVGLKIAVEPRLLTAEAAQTSGHEPSSCLWSQKVKRKREVNIVEIVVVDAVVPIRIAGSAELLGQQNCLH